MAEHFPYQVVGFLDRQPDIGEAVYGGPRGWFAQIALKRRFRLENGSEQEVIASLERFCVSRQPLAIHVRDLTKPARMPVRVLAVKQDDEVIGFHNDLIQALGDKLVSRYPERDGAHYLPHITAEYGGMFVIDPANYEKQTYTISRICLLKDEEGGDSLAHQYFELGVANER